MRCCEAHRGTRALALALPLTLLAGALCLPMPFWGDQALFTVYGRQLADGAVLYRDVFDLKQPGVFLFYTAAGLAFGFTEVGIRLFELAYWVAFSVFAVAALRPYFTTRWAVSLVPVLTVVVYYLYAETLELTQIEILVAFPLLVAWWLIDGADAGTRAGLARYAAAGLGAATVVLFKHLYVLIVLAFLAYAWWRARRQGSRAVGWGGVGAFLVGFLVPLLAVAAYFAAYGQIERIWWAYVEYTAAARSLDSVPLSNLTGGGRRFVVGHAPLVVLATVGCLRVLRQRTRPQLDLVVGMVSWGAIGGVALLVQFWGAWHWLLFTVPVGILAVVGLEALVAGARSLRMRPRPVTLAIGGALAAVSLLAGQPSWQTQHWVLVPVGIGVVTAVAAEVLTGRPRPRRWAMRCLLTALAVCVGLLAIAPASKVRMLAAHDFALTAQDRTELQRSWNPAYEAADEDLQVLRSGQVLPGPLYVLGDPVVLLRAERPQALPLHGWGPEKFDARAWEEVRRGLRADPPPYVVVSNLSESLIRSRSPELLEVVDAKYEPAFDGASGTWYVRR